MKLSLKTSLTVNDTQSNYIGHMVYAAFKLWNICNYERRNYKDLNLGKYPDWYYQKSIHKDDLWYKNLPSQTAQEVLKLLEEAWKSYYALLKSGGVKNPRSPRFKQSGIPITYMQNGIKQEADDTVRLAIPQVLKKFMRDEYGLTDEYLYLKSPAFKKTVNIKQIKLYPPEDDKINIIVVYEVPDVPQLEDNGHYLSIDLGLHNLMTCYDNSGTSFIAGREYLSICRRFDKEIARVQSEWCSQQSAKGIEHPKGSKHIQSLYEKKSNCVTDYLHKMTRAIVEYCKSNDIHTVVIGDITGIRKNANLGYKTNQKLHGFPYAKIYLMLEYKLALYGIRFVKQKEAYSSQCSPYSKKVSKTYATAKNRVKRGLYIDSTKCFNADAVGAYNILRIYLTKNRINTEIPVSGIQSPYIFKVAA